MYRLLIVDDEISIIMGLEKLLTEIEDYEIEIYKTTSSKNAITIAEDKKIDILLTDIDIPIVDGIKLAKIVVDKNKQCRVIYLTGFSNFDYIYNGMQIMGSQFILKSESDIKIKEAVYKAINILENENQEKITKTKIKIEHKKVNSMIKKDILINLLYKDYIKNNISLSDLNILSNKKCYLFVGKLDFFDNNINYLGKIDLFYKVKFILDEKFEENFCIESFLVEDKYIIWIVQDKNSLYIDNKIKIFQVIAEECQKIIINLINCIFSVGFSGNDIELENISYEFKIIKKYISKQVDVKIPMIYKIDVSEKNMEIFGVDDIINKLENYINNNIGSDISLTKLASIVHFNPSYLSRFYKKNRGIKISEFIYNLKLDKAKEMLIKSDKKVSDISESLGFDTVSAFCAFFKKKEGCSPAQYRLKN